MSEVLIYALGYIAVAAFGMVIGSFLNVCIFRIPKGESIIPDSHCMTCGYKLHWYDLVPVFSYIILGGRCRKCGAKLSLQYPLIEGMNGALYVIIFLANGFRLMSAVYCLLTSALIVLSVIDWRTFEIPDRINVFIAVLGVVAVVIDHENWLSHVIGLFAVSLFLLIIYLVTAGAGIGGGDIKLMAATGLLLGWQKIFLGFIIGCIVGSVIHIIRMKVSKADHVLAMGPYLSAGIFIAMMWGDFIINMYLRMCGLA